MEFFKTFQLSFLMIILLIITGCTSIGPKVIHLNRNKYNDVIQETNNEQLLKNIVRIRYVEPTSFLKLSNVTASYTLNPSFSASGTGLTYTTNASAISIPGSTLTRTVDINPSISYSDTPTITYLPVEDAEFVSELMTPITLEESYLLSYGGIYDPQLLLRLITQEIGYIDNASSASSAKMTALPRYKKYYHFLNLLKQAQSQFEYMPTQVHGKYALAIHFLPGKANSSAANALRDLFYIPHNGQDIILGQYNADVSPVNYVLLKTRSIYGIMTYLSYGVEIPDSDTQDIYHYYEPNGQPFDWRPLLNGIISIHCSDTEPVNTFVKTIVHGHWFYIANSDVNSKATFVLLTRLLTLTAGKQLGGSSQGPVLTLPAR